MILQVLLASVLAFSASDAHKLVGKNAIGFTLATVDGKKVSLNNYRGQVVVLNFWATWCEPCKEELPEFERLQRKYRDRGLKILAVSVDNNIKNARIFLKKNDLQLTGLWDYKKRLAGIYNVETMPSTYLIDRYGVIRYVHKGYSPAEFKRIEAETDELLDEM
jgi:peroxiredoxin